MTSKATNDIAILEEKKKREQTLWQWRIFISVYAGYMCYYFTRRSFSLVLPALLRDPSFAHLNKDKVSIVGTVMGITYSLGKVGMGVVADGLSPRVSLSVGLFICACTNLLLSQFSSIGLFAFLWGINGFLQGGGWAACSQLLTQWFPRERVGTIWGITTTSQNVGAALVAILCSYLSEMYGWRVAMWVPGVIGLLVACLAAWGVRVSPASVGLPPANKAASPHEVKASKVESREAKEDQGHNSSLSNATKPSIFEIFRDSYVLMLGIASCLVYGVRIAISDWLALYLVEGKGFSQITAGGCVAWFELGGIAGATVSGLAPRLVDLSLESSMAPLRPCF
jgi:OPA family sugar phosphate sensor protein UhpC-like MFS transporter